MGRRTLFRTQIPGPPPDTLSRVAEGGALEYNHRQGWEPLTCITFMSEENDMLKETRETGTLGIKFPSNIGNL